MRIQCTVVAVAGIPLAPSRRLARCPEDGARLGPHGPPDQGTGRLGDHPDPPPHDTRSFKGRNGLETVNPVRVRAGDHYGADVADCASKSHSLDIHPQSLARLFSGLGKRQSPHQPCAPKSSARRPPTPAERHSASTLKCARPHIGQRPTAHSDHSLPHGSNEHPKGPHCDLSGDATYGFHGGPWRSVHWTLGDGGPTRPEAQVAQGITDDRRPEGLARELGTGNDAGNVRRPRGQCASECSVSP